MESRIARSVSATQLVRDLAGIRALVADGPVGITSHNRTELVMLSAQRFAELSKSGVQSDPAVLDAKLTTVLEAIDTHVVILDRNLRLLRINRSMRLVLGIDDDAQRGTPIADLLPAASAPFIVKRLREVVESGRVAEFDLNSSIRPGRTIHARMVPWPGGVIYLAEDISDRLSGIESDLEFGALRAALASLGRHGSGCVDQSGAILRADDGFCALVGADKDQVASRRFVSLFDPLERPQIERALGIFDRNQVLDVHYLRKGVVLAKARLALAPFFAGDGRPRLAFVVEDRAFRG